jgi:hypothetical protein
MLLWAIVGIVLIGVVLLDAFETVVLPRRVTHGAWLARLVIWVSWHLWSCPARGPWRTGPSLWPLRPHGVSLDL